MTDSKGYELSPKFEGVDRIIEEYKNQTKYHDEFLTNLLEEHKKMNQQYELESRNLEDLKIFYKNKIKEYEEEIGTSPTERVDITLEDMENFKQKISNFISNCKTVEYGLVDHSKEAEWKYFNLLNKFEEKITCLRELESDLTNVNEGVKELELENQLLKQRQCFIRTRVQLLECQLKYYEVEMKKLEITVEKTSSEHKNSVEILKMMQKSKDVSNEFHRSLVNELSTLNAHVHEVQHKMSSCDQNLIELEKVLSDLQMKKVKVIKEMEFVEKQLEIVNKEISKKEVEIEEIAKRKDELSKVLKQSKEDYKSKSKTCQDAIAAEKQQIKDWEKEIQRLNETILKLQKHHEEFINKFAELKISIMVMEEKIKNCLIPGDQVAPTGDVTIVFTDIKGSATLWEQNHKMMEDALMLHNCEIKKILSKPHINGFEVKTIGDSFMCAFFSPIDAVDFALQIQCRFLEIDWPDELKKYESSKRIEGKSTALFNGLRIKIGIFKGTPIINVDSTTKREDYFGPSVNIAARLVSKAQGGMILTSNEVWQSVKNHLNDLSCPVFSKDIGEIKLKGLSKPEHVFIILPEHLKERMDYFEPQNK